jgi:hypothetical protein
MFAGQQAELVGVGGRGRQGHAGEQATATAITTTDARGSVISAATGRAKSDPGDRCTGAQTPDLVPSP